MKNYVTEHLSQAALYEQLAEECTELGKAALKMARILRNENPTPVTKEEAQASLTEEYTDVVQTAVCLDLKYDIKQATEKDKRWKGRLEKHLKEQEARPTKSKEESWTKKFKFIGYGIKYTIVGNLITLKFLDMADNLRYDLHVNINPCDRTTVAFMISLWTKDEIKLTIDEANELIDIASKVCDNLRGFRVTKISDINENRGYINDERCAIHILKDLKESGCFEYLARKHMDEYRRATHNVNETNEPENTDGN